MESTTTAPSVTPRARMSTRRRALAIVFALIVLLLGLQLARMSLTVNSMRTHARGLLIATGDQAKAQSAGAILSDYRELRRQLGWLPNVGPALSWVPRYGGDAAAAPQLLELGDALADAAEPSLALLETFLVSSQGGDPPGAVMIAIAQQRAPLLAQARAALKRAAAARARVDAARLGPEVRAQLTKLDRGVNAWAAALALLERTPALLGADRPRAYLLLAQNSDELRATGGFISGAGLLVVENGQVAVTDFRDSYAVDDPKLPHPPPPEALRQYMDATQWTLRDANWYADFPTTASVAKSLYQLDRGVPTDGVIAIDTHLLPLLLRAFGSVTVENETVTAENVMAQMQAHWAPPPATGVTQEWWLHRKDFMGQLLEAVMARIKDGQFERTPLALAFVQGLDAKNVMVQLDDVEANSALLEANWGGALYHGPGDHLLVVDSNVGFNKANARVTAALTYSVALDTLGARAAVDLSYKHQAPPSNEECVHQPYYGKTYDDLEKRCYWDYLRLIVPLKSELASARGVEAARVTEDLSAVTAFQGYFVLARGATRNVRYEYTLPPSVSAGSVYQLTLQRQAGARALPVHVRVQLPSEWEVGATNVEPSRREANAVEFDFTLEQDTTLVVGVNRTRALPWAGIVAVGALLVIAGGIFLMRAARRK